MAQQQQGVLYCLPHLGVFRLKLANKTVDIPLDKSEVARGTIMVSLGKAFTRGDKLPEPVSVDFVLPHQMYGVDFMTLPNIKSRQLEDAYKAKLRSMFKNYEDLEFQKQIIQSGKTITFRVMFVRRVILDECKDGFARLNINIARFIPEGVAVQEQAAKLDASVKRGSSILLNIGDQESFMCAYNGEVMYGGLPIPFGVRALADNRLMYEKALAHTESAELIVINAKERAKATKLTMAIDLEEEIDDSVPSEDETIEKDPARPDLTKAGTDATNAAAPEAPEEEEEEVKTLRKSAVRVLPKFMRREEPTTREGYVLENFRMFEKRILMLARELSLGEYFAKIENVYVVLPKGYEFVIESMKVENPGLKWKGIFVKDELPALSAFGHIGGKGSVF